MSNLQSGAVPRFSGSLKFSPEGAWSYCSGIAGFAFPLAGLRAGACLMEAAQLVVSPSPSGGILASSALSLAEFPGKCFTPAIHAHTLADTETNHLSSGIWGKRQQKMA